MKGRKTHIHTHVKRVKMYEIMCFIVFGDTNYVFKGWELIRD